MLDLAQDNTKIYRSHWTNIRNVGLQIKMCYVDIGYMDINPIKWIEGIKEYTTYNAE